MIEKIVNFMSREGISIAAVQKTKLNSYSDLVRCAGINGLHKDRERDTDDSPAFILHNIEQYSLIDGDIECRDNIL